MKLYKEPTIVAISGILAVLFAISAVIYRPDTSATVDGITPRPVQIGNRKINRNENVDTIQKKPAFTEKGIRKIIKDNQKQEKQTKLP